MRLDSLNHLARAVLAMTEVDQLIVFGSASLLATRPELGELGDSPLQSTYDADVLRERVGQIPVSHEILGRAREFLAGVVA